MGDWQRLSWRAGKDLIGKIQRLKREDLAKPRFPKKSKTGRSKRLKREDLLRAEKGRSSWLKVLRSLTGSHYRLCGLCAVWAACGAWAVSCARCVGSVWCVGSVCCNRVGCVLCVLLGLCSLFCVGCVCCGLCVVGCMIFWPVLASPD